jgi:3-deoxy-D-manno-octulosonic-acid transferase
VSLAWNAYRLAAPCVGAILPAARIFVPPHGRDRWDQRLGRTRLPAGADAWVHAASMGEATAVGPFVSELRALAPRSRFILTAMTRGGCERLGALGEPAAIAPLDSPQAAARFFAGVTPRRCLLLETELWPHWLLQARISGVPVAVVSARLSGTSVARYRRLGAGFRGLVSGLAAVLCQSETDLERWRSLGARAEVSTVTGNLKDDGLPAAAPDRGLARVALGLERERPLLVMGCVRPGEVQLLARAWRRLPAALRQSWQVVAVPRHPRASAGLRAEAARAGQALAGPGGGVEGAWNWDDRLGALRGYYEVADVVFVGGSLSPYGGHSPLEPAACGAALLMGPHHASQRDAVRELQAAGALRVAGSEAEVASALERLLGDAAARVCAGRAALGVVEQRRGAARRTAARLVELGLWGSA